MPRLRKKDKHLPPRVYFKHNAYHYVDTKNKWHRLGSTFTEAIANWAKKINPDSKKITTMHHLFDRYMIEIAPAKSEASHKSNLANIKPLRIWFGDMQPDEVTPVDIYRYLDKRALKAKVSANREKSLLSHVFTMAIRWGVVRDNPCRNVKRITEKPRRRYIENHEFIALRSIAPTVIQLMMDIAYLTGQRIGDILRIKISDLTDEGIRIEQSKTGVKLLIMWTDPLRECVNKIRSLPRSVIHSFTLFCNRRGAPMTYDSFSTVWQKTMKKALERGLIQESFTFHDIRAKAASDAKNPEHASSLLGHSSVYLTEKTYIRNHKKIVPIKEILDK